MPNLKNLRKQAKLFLRWHRDGHYPVAAQIRAMLRRLHGLSDHEVLQQSVKLADAQELVARQAGFESWQALKAGVQAITDTKASANVTPALNAAEPELFVADFGAACAFYTAKLGFEIVFTYGEPPFFGQVRRGKALLNLRLMCEPVFVGDVREREELMSAGITVNSAAEIRALFAKFQAAGVDFFRTLKPEGNLLLFAGTATQSL